MKVWVLTDHYEEIHLLPWDKNPLENRYVKEELSYLAGAYEDERDEFINNVEAMRRTGRGSASIEGRFTLEIKTLL